MLPDDPYILRAKKVRSADRAASFEDGEALREMAACLLHFADYASDKRESQRHLAVNTKNNPRVIDGTYHASRDPVLLAIFALEAIVIGSVIVTLWYL
jgi:hypothetical protein